MSWVGVSTPNPGWSQSQEAATIDRTAVVMPPIHPSNHQERKAQAPLPEEPVDERQPSNHPRERLSSRLTITSGKMSGSQPVSSRTSGVSSLAILMTTSRHM